METFRHSFYLSGFALLVVIVFVSMLFNLSFATPQITGVLESPQGLVNGATLVISGSGFGNKVPAKPYVWAGFEQGSIQPSNYGQNINWSESAYMVYNATGGVNGGPDAVGVKDDAQPGIWTLAINSNGFNWNDYGSKIYLFYDTYKNFCTSGPSSTCPLYINWKIMRIWNLNISFSAPNASSPPYCTLCYPDFYMSSSNGAEASEYLENNSNPDRLGYDATVYAATYVNGSGVQTDPSVTDGPIGKWFPQQMILQSNSQANTFDGNLKWYSNGSEIGLVPIDLRWTTFTLKFRINGSITEAMRRLYIQGVQENVNWLFTGSNGTAKTYAVDNIYIDNTWSRVMVCNSATWSTCTKEDIEIPTAWSNDSITVLLRTGEFSSFSNLYLYVVDANGNVNQNGYPI